MEVKNGNSTTKGFLAEDTHEKEGRENCKVPVMRKCELAQEIYGMRVDKTKGVACLYVIHRLIV